MTEKWMDTTDKLDRIFEMQKKLQRITHPDLDTFEGDIQYMRLMALGAQEEICEILRDCGWKPWKQSSKFDKHAAKHEYIDLLHFVINMAFGLGLAPDELYKMYEEKNNENLRRQADGY